MRAIATDCASIQLEYSSDIGNEHIVFTVAISTWNIPCHITENPEAPISKVYMRIDGRISRYYEFPI